MIDAHVHLEKRRLFSIMDRDATIFTRMRSQTTMTALHARQQKSMTRMAAQERGESYEIYTAWKFGFESIPHLHGVNGFWRCTGGAAFLDG